MDNLKNGLIFQRIKSKTELFNDVDFNSFYKFGFNDEDFIIIYLYNEVIFERIRNLKSAEILNRLIRLRIFNGEKELLLWREDKNIKGRLRIDYEGEECEVTDVFQVIYGTEFETENGTTILTEERGTVITLPFTVTGINDKDKKDRIKIKTRNYIHYLNDLQASYYDTRFIEFAVGENNQKIGGN